MMDCFSLMGGEQNQLLDLHGGPTSGSIAAVRGRKKVGERGWTLWRRRVSDGEGERRS